MLFKFKFKTADRHPFQLIVWVTSALVNCMCPELHSTFLSIFHDLCSLLSSLVHFFLCIWKKGNCELQAQFSLNDKANTCVPQRSVFLKLQWTVKTQEESMLALTIIGALWALFSVFLLTGECNKACPVGETSVLCVLSLKWRKGVDSQQ
jgi:hypothetical protein